MSEFKWDDKTVRDMVAFCIGYEQADKIISEYKYKQPLFTTEDGKDIYDEDSVFIVNSVFSDWSIYRIDKERYDDLKTHCKFFSTAEAAKEYILMNKPCLNLKDVLSLIESKDYPINGINYTITYRHIDQYKLKQLVKDKLKY